MINAEITNTIKYEFKNLPCFFNFLIFSSSSQYFLKKIHDILNQDCAFFYSIFGFCPFSSLIKKIFHCHECSNYRAV